MKKMKKIDPKRTDLTAEERRLLMLQGLEDAKTKGIGKKAGGMMKKGYAKGKMVKKMMAGGKTKKMMSAGGKLKMVEGKDGKQVPFYAADGVGKMKAGGMMKKGYKRGRKVVKDDTSLNEGQGGKKKNTMAKIAKGAAMLGTPLGALGGSAMMGAKNIMKQRDENIARDMEDKVKKQNRPGKDNFKAGKMVKKMMAGGKTKGAANGGKKSKVRGSGIAKKGVRPAKMR